MKINEWWEDMNIQSKRVIVKRQTRSIQAEGHFGDIKENENLRRFHYRSEGSTSQNQNKGFLRPKIDSKKRDIPVEVQGFEKA